MRKQVAVVSYSQAVERTALTVSVLWIAGHQGQWKVAMACADCLHSWLAHLLAAFIERSRVPMQELGWRDESAPD